MFYTMANSDKSNLNTSLQIQKPIASGKSRLNGYDEFMSWRKSWNINSFSEEVFMEFFREAAETLPPKLLSKLFYTLKYKMRSMHNVHIVDFASLIAFLTQKGLRVIQTTCGKQMKGAASKALSNEEINKFLTEAPDAEYLAIKTATVIGIHADCPFADIRNIRVNMVNDFGTEIVVQIPHNRIGISKVYSISGEFAAIVRKYLRLRLRTPNEIKTVTFFIQFRQGKCVPGAMGRRTLGIMAQKIATFLKLEHPESYTTESFRMISPKLVGKGFETVATERNRSTFPTRNATGSIGNSSNVATNNETNSIDYMRLSSNAESYGFHCTYEAINVHSDDGTDRVHTFDSSSEDDGNVIEYTNQTGEEITTNNCTSTKQQQRSQLHSNMQFVVPSPKPNKKVPYPNGINAEIVDTVTHQMLQSKIEEQAREIVGMKQLIQKQSLEIEILKDLLKKHT